MISRGGTLLPHENHGSSVHSSAPPSIGMEVFAHLHSASGCAYEGCSAYQLGSARPTGNRRLGPSGSALAARPSGSARLGLPQHPS